MTETVYICVNVNPEATGMNKRFYAVATLAIALILPILILSNYVNTEADPSGSGTYEGFSYTYDGTDATITGYSGSLSEIEIPDYIEGKKVIALGDDAFMSRKSLVSAVIPDSVGIIGDRAFFKCTGLTAVVLGSSVISIGDRTFSECRSLESVIIPDSV